MYEAFCGFRISIDCLKKKFNTYFLENAQNEKTMRLAIECILKSKSSRFPKRKFTITCSRAVFLLISYFALPPISLPISRKENISKSTIHMPKLKSKAKAKNLGAFAVKVGLQSPKSDVFAHFPIRA
jgi:hypothetical protein